MWEQFWSEVDVNFDWTAALRTLGLVFLASGLLNKMGWKWMIKKDFRETKMGELWQQKAFYFHGGMGACCIIASYFDIKSPIAIILLVIAFLLMVWAAIENIRLMRSNAYEVVEVFEDEWEGQKKSKIKEILYNQAQAELKKKEEAEAARLAAEAAEAEEDEYEDFDGEDVEEADDTEEANENEDK